MVQIQVTGPEHSGKGYIMVAIARALRDLGAQVVLQGEETHLTDKIDLAADHLSQRLSNQEVRITELKTGI